MANTFLPFVDLHLSATQHGVTDGCCSPHSFLLCEHLHPTEVSCFKNFFAAFKDEAVKFGGWVAGATVVSMLISGKLQFSQRKFTCRACGSSSSPKANNSPIYQFRLATFSVWKVWKARGGWGIKHGELWLIAACWVALLRYKYLTTGNRITGVVGQLIGMFDGTEFTE
ncbi:hypothetical protein FRC04_008028 [Tulasnella sp. 424]|nr:hypothetical protein FRC04_008028 [Tulasnella sp. 424]